MKPQFLEKFNRAYRALLPSPLSIALILTIASFILALIYTKPQNKSSFDYLLELSNYWEKGLWGMDLMDGTWKRSWQLPFLVQMMLMLVLGYVLAMSKPLNWLINRLTKYCTSNARAVFVISFFTIFISLLNWGLGLVFGAIFARKVAEFATRNQIKINYGLLGAAGYSGMMVWHGGLSGSAPIKAAEPESLTLLLPKTSLTDAQISLDQTVFSPMNLFVTILLITIIPTLFFLIGQKTSTKLIDIKPLDKTYDRDAPPIGAEQLDHSSVFSSAIGGFILLYAVYSAFFLPASFSLAFLTPDFINLTLLALVFIFHQNVMSFLRSLNEAIGSASGILIQFPFYFGILGIMKYSGLMTEMSAFFVSISSQDTFSINTLFSAGIVNIFVPSGGGQWAIQGPVVLEAANQLNLPLAKNIMAIAYGDQLTNMLQPFWALPLLGITGLKPKSILPFTLVMMLVGLIIFILGLLLF